MPTGRYQLAVVSGADGRIYALGGNTLGARVPTAEAYNPDSNTWSGIASMPTAREGLAGAKAPSGRIYAIGGFVGDVTNKVEAYDADLDFWFTVTPMPTARFRLAAATGENGLIYVFGGSSGSGDSRAVEAYDPDFDNWRTVASMPTARNQLATATGFDGRVYAIGGFTSRGETLNTLEVYDPTTNRWSILAPMPTARGGLAAATGPDGLIYAIGGSAVSCSCVLSTVEAYDPETDTWTLIPSLPDGRTSLGAATGPDGVMYSIGGTDGLTAFDLVETYTPASTFTFASLEMAGARGFNNVGQIVGTFGLLDGDVVIPLEVPGSRTGSTVAYGINDEGDIGGKYTPSTGPLLPQGFLYRDGMYMQITFERAVEVLGINNSGYKAGRSCCRRGGSPEGFIIDPTGGHYFFDVPTSPWDWASGINASGQIVGTFMPRRSVSFAFETLLYVDGLFNPSGQTVGTSLSGTALPLPPFQAYLYSDGVFTSISFPEASRTEGNGINDAGQIVGFYENLTGTHGFLRDTNGIVTVLDFPGTIGATVANGVNDTGQILGNYSDSTGNHVFVATPVAEPTASQFAAPGTRVPAVR